MVEKEILNQMLFFELNIPAWQMVLYVLMISVCMLLEKHKLALITTYVFTLNWGFFFYFGDVIYSFRVFPNMATLFLLSGLLHISLTLVAFLREESPVEDSHA
jgi:hypothetical protein